MNTRVDQASGRASFIRALWAVCLGLGTCTHVLVIAKHGWAWDYGGMPLFTREFWSSLTVLDPLAAILLFVRPRLGVIATAAIMITDVAHNIWVLFAFGGGRPDPFVILQAAFLLFVAVTASAVWRAFPASPTQPA